ncbi:hypothetical protein CC77DRAFT_723015 [Alternaria alternata]|uniref:Secreted protein n=1 Tax=Alternaria alternata TaxID=5599 RepID=A0A177DXM6_ALTAL|nr:hypothetical protein CC77DRAFT_723015 [Alternaria alternata]OAG23539.1 hypothetical protein CC77DRAFT_723015 [Alternaria alternata]
MLCTFFILSLIAFNMSRCCSTPRSRATISIVNTWIHKMLRFCWSVYFTSIVRSFNSDQALWTIRPSSRKNLEFPVGGFSPCTIGDKRGCKASKLSRLKALPTRLVGNWTAMRGRNAIPLRSDMAVSNGGYILQASC